MWVSALVCLRSVRSCLPRGKFALFHPAERQDHLCSKHHDLSAQCWEEEIIAWFAYGLTRGS